MTPRELGDCLEAMGWSQRQLARHLGGVGKTTIQRWADGRAPVPDCVATWLRARAADDRRLAYPDGWSGVRS